MTPFVAEFLGTLLLILFGNGVVSNVVLAKTKGNNSGLIVIATGWAIAVFVGALVSVSVSGAHLNPAVTIACYFAEKITADQVVPYILAQMAGAIVGAVLVYLYYRKHFEATIDGDAQLACFSNSPAIPGNMQAFFCEAIGTFALVLPVYLVRPPSLSNVAGTSEEATAAIGLGTLELIPLALIVFGIGLSLGGTTGYAINPARDLGPRIAHFLLPIPNKRDSNWSYAWVPVFGPIVGAIVAALIYNYIKF